MGMVALAQRIASAFVVFCGDWGAVSRQARACHSSRQRIYRQAHHVQRRLEETAWQQERQELRAQLQRLGQENERLRQRLAQAVVLDADKQAQFASAGQAQGVSLPVLHRLLNLLQPGRARRVAQLGRWSKQAGQKAARLLAVLDEAARPRVRQALADEVYVRDPVLMVVEPDSLCWLAGRKVARQELTGQAWAEQLGALPALEQVTCDAGPSLCRGVQEVNAQRRQAGRPELAEQRDHFHALRHGGRVVGGLEKRTRGAVKRAEELEGQLARCRRDGRPLRGLSNRARAAWAKAERLMERWSHCARLWERVKQALPLVTPQGELNRRARAEAILAEVLPQLPEAFAPSRNLLQQQEALTYLDRVHQRLQALEAPPEVRAAAVRQETLRQRPELWRGEGPSAAALRGVLFACATVLHLSGAVGQQVVEQVRSILRQAWRASSLVECVNSVVRMQQARHRKLTQGLLDLKRLYWNTHAFRTGRRRGTSPYQRLGLPWPEALCWGELLKMPPEHLRQKLSAQGVAA
ncbi:MAG TPA: hypothetical protein VHN78_02880 [Chloroflexota bacterium]|nr:hypothetical protein [Chloroflexota bacterium]